MSVLCYKVLPIMEDSRDIQIEDFVYKLYKNKIVLGKIYICKFSKKALNCTLYIPQQQEKIF